MLSKAVTVGAFAYGVDGMFDRIRRASTQVTRRSDAPARESSSEQCAPEAHVQATKDLPIPKCICGADMTLVTLGSDELKDIDGRYKAMSAKRAQNGSDSGDDPNAFDNVGWLCGITGDMEAFGESDRYICSRTPARCQYDLSLEAGEACAASYQTTVKRGWRNDEKLGIKFTGRGGLETIRNDPNNEDWAHKNTNFGNYLGYYVTKVRDDETGEEADMHTANDFAAVKKNFVDRKDLTFTVRTLQNGDQVELTNFRDTPEWNKIMGTVINQVFAPDEEVRFEFDFNGDVREFTTVDGAQKEVKHHQKGRIVMEDTCGHDHYHVEITRHDKQTDKTETFTVGKVHASVLRRIHRYAIKDAEYWTVRVDVAANELNKKKMPKELQQKFSKEPHLHIQAKRLRKIKNGNTVLGGSMKPLPQWSHDAVVIKRGEYYNAEHHCYEIFSEAGEIGVVHDVDEELNLYYLAVETGGDDELYIEVYRQDLETEVEYEMNRDQGLPKLEAQMTTEKMSEEVVAALMQQAQAIRDDVDNENIIEVDELNGRIRNLESQVKKALEKYKTLKKQLQPDELLEEEKKAKEKAMEDEKREQKRKEKLEKHRKMVEAAQQAALPTPPGCVPTEPESLEKKYTKPENKGRKYAEGESVYYWDRKNERELAANIDKDYGSNEYDVKSQADGKIIEASGKRLRPRVLTPHNPEK